MAVLEGKDLLMAGVGIVCFLTYYIYINLEEEELFFRRVARGCLDRPINH
jgi:hypothetical protein